MYVIADLQLHSRFSRAVSPQMTIPNIAHWAARKGIGLVATGDWTHPLWMREIQSNLEELGNGLLRLTHVAQGPEVGMPLSRAVKVQTASSPYSLTSQGRDGTSKGHASPGLADSSPRANTPLFLLATEVSCIYSQGGRVRRVHTLIWVPSLASAEKINKEMTRRGCNLMSDGRPIIGLTSIQVAELVLSIEPKALIIPAHCLLPDSMILGSEFLPKRIDTISEGDTILTHTGEFHTVTEVKKRPYKGPMFHIQPWYFRPGLVTTPEHPYWAIRTVKKCPSTGDICRPSRTHLSKCKKKECLQYKPSWIFAEDLQVGDVLVYPRSRTKNPVSKMVLDATKRERDVLKAGGTRGRVIANTLPITPELGRLIGYYLAEGSTDGINSFAFCFSSKEQEYTDDVVQLVKNVFGVEHHRIYRREASNGIELVFYSKLHAQWFAAQCYIAGQRHNAGNKRVPVAILESEHSAQAECLRGWYRGDHGYTTSRILMNQIKAMCLRLGIIPSIIVDRAIDHKRRGNHVLGDRKIKANYDVYAVSNFSFFEDPYDLKKEIPRSQTKLDRKHGWIDKSNVYLPIRDITTRNYEGDVYNLEVEEDHSYIAEFAAVHNCWTPWFSVYGSLGGFDTIEEAFGPYAKHIYAVETGLSSNPSMNWRIKELDHRAIVSFSDAHSGPKLGREATVFEMPDGKLSYDAIYNAIKQTPAEVGMPGAGPASQALRSAHLWSRDGQGPDPPGISTVPGAKAVAIAAKRCASPRLLDSSPQPSIAYTIEFYPEEGKYHYTGHRLCNIRLSPQDSKQKGSTCPVCGKPLTQGVMQRVDQLASRSEAELRLASMRQRINASEAEVTVTKSKAFPERPAFVMLVPLQEIIAEAVGSPVSSPKVQTPYFRLTDELGGEFNVLLSTSLEDITKIAGSRVAAGVDKVRRGDLVIDPGYDGVFGVVKLWGEGEEKPLVDASKEQLSIF